MSTLDTTVWTTVCSVADVPIDRGVAVIVGDDMVALFRLSPVVRRRQDGGESPRDEEWYAVSHTDPLTGQPVMARGLVGSVGIGPIVVPTIASPLHKQRYNLKSGYCLDDETARLRTFGVRIAHGQVQVGHEVRPG